MMKTTLRLLTVCLAASLFFTACSQPPDAPPPTAAATVLPASPTAAPTETAVPPVPTPVPTETAVSPAPTDTPIPNETADIIFYNGRILTMNPAQPTAQAIAIRGDAILAVGSSDEILAYRGDDTQTVDLEGLTITPGFIDSHAHRIGDRWHFGDVSAEQILDEALSQGWTSIHEMFVTDGRLAELQAMADADALPVRVSMYLTMNFEYDATDWWREYRPLQQFGPYLQIAGLKITLDREWGEQIFFSQEQYNNLVLAGTEDGWQIATHSFSPTANAIVLAGYGAALNGQSNDTLRLRLEHTGTMTDDEVRQMARLGVIGSVQLSAVSWVDDASFKRNISADEVEHTARWRDMLDADIFLIGNTDSPWCCTDWRNDFQRPPYQATAVRTLYQGVTRTGFGGRQPEPWQLAQAVTVQEALEMLTINGAYAAHQEDAVGSLESGKYADMVILSANPLEIPVEQIADIQVDMTMVGGQVRFCSEGQDRLCPQAGTAISPTEPLSAAETADLIFYNGRILTMESDQPTAQAIALRGQKITAVGSNITILALKEPATQVIDLHGLTLMPGIIDAHSHLFNDTASAGLDMDQAQQLALENGITSFADMYVTEDFLQEMQAYEQQGKLRLHTSLYLAYTDPCGVVQGDWYKTYPPTRNLGEMLRIGGVKIFADGGVCGKAALSTGYPDGGYGDLWFTQDELNRAVAEAQNAGYQVAIHAQGDLAIEQAQNAIEAALAGQPNTFRHRIEHNPLARPDLLPRYSEIGIVPIAWGEYPTCAEVNDAYYSSFFGAEPMPWLENWRAFLDANPNLPVAWHSDFPYAAINPFLHLYSYVTRQEIDADGTVCLPPDWLAAHRITVDEALPMMTLNGAYALFRDEEVGSLKVGKYADLIIISADPTAIGPNDLLNIQVQMTMVSGQVAFCAEGQTDLCPQRDTAVSPTATPLSSAAASGITASAAQATDPPENAFDGSLDTVWISGADAPQWIAIDLGEPMAVSGIRLTVAMYPDGRTTHRVYGKTPDGNYQLLHEFQSDTTDGQALTYTPPEPWGNIQFIKIETTESPSWVAWKEIVIETP